MLLFTCYCYVIVSQLLSLSVINLLPFYRYLLLLLVYYPELLKSKYQVSLVLYRRQFFSICEGIANTFKTVSVEVLPILFWSKNQYFLPKLFFYCLLSFAVIESVFSPGGKIITLLHLSCKLFEIMMFLRAWK